MVVPWILRIVSFESKYIDSVYNIFIILLVGCGGMGVCIIRQGSITIFSA